MSGPPPKLSHRVEYLGLRLVQGVVRALPEGPALGLGAGVAGLAGALGVRRAQVAQSLGLAFGDRPLGWRKRIAREAFGHLGRETAQLLRLGGLAQDGLRAFMLDRTEWADVQSEAVFNETLALSRSGRGSILAAGHLGNWEICGGALVARGLALDAVAVRQRNPFVDKELRGLREDMGLGLMDRKAAVRGVARSLRAGRCVALIADQHTPDGVVLPFFGHRAATPRGPAVFSLRTGAPLVFAGAVGREGSPRRYHIFMERLKVSDSGDLETDIKAVTLAMNQALERRIEADPAQYLWHHRRWRRQVLQAPGTEA